MLGRGRMALQALQMFVPREFFNVHALHDQNSPFLSVMSTCGVVLFNFEPPHTMHTVAVPELTSVHFLHVQSGACCSSGESAGMN